MNSVVDSGLLYEQLIRVDAETAIIVAHLDGCSSMVNFILLCKDKFDNGG